MEQQTAISVFESLASGLRLDVFRLLVRQGHAGMVAGEIGATLGIAPTKLSFHLKALSHAQLVTVTPEGRFLRYRANLALMAELVSYLTEECCAGQTEQCPELPAPPCCPPSPAQTDRPVKN
ncbi:helix-turn-helix domain-containing protein [Niveibacterium sp. 24ML]|uniref:ArsR/SmtB family transcription factor n=1 Tax=Niveibacterium sp. 24ML TaxID=2985512 RepID=UPI00226D5C76|nr:helix-turn-helix domain-containing protein [Niveibacterium sp. 24ML]MCX9155861.1 helix-turn-helix domain-containing protein [Niveibacterium sp. 24ML]